MCNLTMKIGRWKYLGHRRTVSDSASRLWSTCAVDKEPATIMEPCQGAVYGSGGGGERRPAGLAPGSAASVANESHGIASSISEGAKLTLSGVR